MEYDERAVRPSWLSRRWVRVCIVGGVVAVLGLVLAHVVKRPGVYWSEADVRFVGPSNPMRPNSLQVSERSLVMTAGTVLEMIDDSDGPQPADPTATLVGLGVRDGWSITLPNSGGQYQNSFVDPFLVVQAVGPTSQEVSATVTRLIARITSALAALQRAEHVAPRDRITAKVLPAGAAPVYYEHGSHTRAYLVSIALLIAAGATAAGAVSRLDRWLARRRTRRSARRLRLPTGAEPSTTRPVSSSFAMRG